MNGTDDIPGRWELKCTAEDGLQTNQTLTAVYFRPKTICMKKIGFIDFYLDEWHANNLPTWIRQSTFKDRIGVGYAWAEKDRDGGVSSDQWCQENGVTLVGSPEEGVSKSDYLIILSPDNPERHEELADLALRSGKPVYIDKTFAPDVATARRMFSLAEEHGTPMFSSSALRFAEELQPLHNVARSESLRFVATGGGGNAAIYAVHQLEMIVSLMGVGARRVIQCGTEEVPTMIIDYGDGRRASLQIMEGMPFRLSACAVDGTAHHFPNLTPAFFHQLVEAVLQFFDTREIPVPKEETIEIMALLDSGRRAVGVEGWVPVTT